MYNTKAFNRFFGVYCKSVEGSLVRACRVIPNVKLVIVSSRAQNKPEAAVAVHCVAGLGRAPVMVAIALIELGMKYEEAVETIRE